MSTETENEERGWPIPLWSAQVLNLNDKEPALNLVECHDCGTSDVQQYMHLWPRIPERPAAKPAFMVCKDCNKRRRDLGATNTFTPVLHRLLDHHGMRPKTN